MRYQGARPVTTHEPEPNRDGLVLLPTKRAIFQRRGDLPTDAERDCPNLEPEVEVYVKQFGGGQDPLALSPGGKPNQRELVRFVGEDLVDPHRYAIYRNNELIDGTGLRKSTIARLVGDLVDCYAVARQTGLVDSYPRTRALQNVMRFLYEWTTHPSRVPPTSEDLRWMLLLAAKELYTGADVVGSNWELLLYPWVGPVAWTHDASIAVRDDTCDGWEVVVEAGSLDRDHRAYVERGIDNLATELLVTGLYTPDGGPAYDPDELPDELFERLDAETHPQAYCDCGGDCWHYGINSPLDHRPTALLT